MSHEGIRIVDRETAAREEAAEQRVSQLSREAVTPAKVRVRLSEGTGVEITWKDGHQSEWSFPWLRHACPCATCNEEREKTGRKTGAAPAEKPGVGPFVLYKAPPRPVSVEPIGKYALKFKWNDGHESGIYSWTYLRGVCQCPAC